MPAMAKVGAFPDEEQASRTARWLRRSGLHPRMTHVGAAFEVAVPSGSEEQRAHLVLHALERVGEHIEPAEPTAWEWVRSRLLNLEVAGLVVAVVFGLVLLGAVGLWLWELGSAMGWLVLVLMLVAGLAYFHFSGIPHSAVKAPRPYSHKHDITMDVEQQVQYRLAWSRDEYRRSQRWKFWRRRPKE